MRTELCIAQADLETLKQQLLGVDTERCAVLLASQSTRSDEQIRMLVREVIFPDQKEYTSQSALDAELSPLFVAQVAKRAAKNKLALVFVHTHLDDDIPDFSRVDDRGEQPLRTFLNTRNIEGHHAALVISQGGMRARLLGTQDELRIVSIGSKRRVEFDPDLDDGPTSATFDRQVRAFGAAGQKQLQKLTVAIVGLGGTGSIMAQQLVHLGVRDFILIDHDSIEETNLNRVVGAARSDLGANKAEIAARYVQGFGSDIKVDVVAGDVST